MDAILEYLERDVRELYFGQHKEELQTLLKSLSLACVSFRRSLHQLEEETHGAARALEGAGGTFAVVDDVLRRQHDIIRRGVQLCRQLRTSEGALRQQLEGITESLTRDAAMAEAIVHHWKYACLTPSVGTLDSTTMRTYHHFFAANPYINKDSPALLRLLAAAQADRQLV